MASSEARLCLRKQISRVTIRVTLSRQHCLTHRLHRRLSLWLSLSRLNSLLLHRQRAVDVVELVVEPAGIAHGLALTVPAPQSCRRRVTVITAQPASPVAGSLEAIAKRRRERREETERRLDQISIFYILNQLIRGKESIITADGALTFGIRLAGRGTLFCLLYSAHRLHRLWPLLSRRHSGVSELAQFT